MTKNTARAWMTRTGVVALLTIPAVVCTGLPANAAPTRLVVQTASGSDVRSSLQPIEVAQAGRSVAAASTGSGSSDVGTQSLGSLVRAAINALRGIPALWNKVAAGAKKSYAWFAANVWPSIKSTVQFVSGAITAWDIWKFFN